jgi:hypothetical protein
VDVVKVKSVKVGKTLNFRTFVDRGAVAETWKPADAPSFEIINHDRAMTRCAAPLANNEGAAPRIPVRFAGELMRRWGSRRPSGGTSSGARILALRRFGPGLRRDGFPDCGRFPLKAKTIRLKMAIVLMQNPPSSPAEGIRWRS